MTTPKTNVQAPAHFNLRAHQQAIRKLLKRGLPIDNVALAIPATDGLDDYIRQLSVPPGPVKLNQFRAALLLRDAPKLYSQDGKGDEAVAYVKLFDPCGSSTFFLLEWDRNEEAYCWGYAISPDYAEHTYIDLREIANVAGRMGIGIEIDTHFRLATLGEIKKKLGV